MPGSNWASLQSMPLLASALAVASLLSFPTPASAETITFSGTQTQTGRVFRDGVPASCPSKPYPGIFNPSTTYNYETRTYTNPGGAQCVVFQFDPNSGPTPCGTNAHLSIYAGPYDSNNQGANFIGDVGSSVTQPMSVDVGAGATVTLVVTNTAGQANCSFTISPTGGSATAGLSKSQRAGVAIHNFMVRRADVITGMQLNTTRFHLRLGAAAFAGGLPPGASGPMSLGAVGLPPPQAVATATDVETGSRPVAGTSSPAASEAAASQSSASAQSPLPVTGSVTEDGGTLAFDMSMAEMRAAKAAREAANGRSSLGMGPGGHHRVAADRAPVALDMWAKGTVSYYRADIGAASGRQKGPAYLMQVGADVLVAPNILVGTVVQMDWLEDSSATMDTKVDGRGWMAGPYVSVNLGRQMFFDARAAWGTSDNTVRVGADYTEDFDTTRWLTSAKLTGHWMFDRLRVSPNAEVVYFSEKQRQFTDSLGIVQPSQSVALGRLLFGPDFAYQVGVVRHTAVELQLGLKGIWDFDRDELIGIDALTAGTDELRGKIEAGVNLVAVDGMSLLAVGAYDGIGASDYHAYQFRLEGRIPFPEK